LKGENEVKSHAHVNMNTFEETPVKRMYR